MEFLRTPDPAAASVAHAGGDKSAPPSTCGAGGTATPAPNGPALDRAGIKSSFQQLFTPSVGGALPSALPSALPGALPGAQPAFLTPFPPGTGLTPFIGAAPGATPNLVTPAVGLVPFSTPLKADGARTAATPELLSSPYLQAAAKEAVRREFMNMPSYIAGVGAVPIVAPMGAPPAESPQQQTLVYTKDGQPVPPSAAPAPVASSTATTADSETVARVPGSDTSAATEKQDDSGSPGARKVPQQSDAAKTSSPKQSAPLGQPGQNVPGQPFFASAPPGMILMPQMMTGPPPPNAFFVHPGMMYGAPGAPHLVPMMAMPAPAPSRPAGPPKEETPDERKERIEREKQDLIREFKKKTREAALVRFRQKRRERRFGKLIRYECRKQLADARPRVKGRFVRIRNEGPTSVGSEDSEGAPQVVPNME